MSELENNPFEPIELWDNTMITVKEGDSKKLVDAKHYHIRYVVGESTDKKFVDDGSNKVESMEDKTVYLVSSIHKQRGDPFHYDASAVHSISGKDRIDGRTKHLSRLDFCDGHEIVEVSYESPGVECCPMTKEEAIEKHIPIQYLAGYYLGRKDGLVKIALAKTEIESGDTIFENIHIIPDAVIREMSCLE
ncbi:MAG: hypothetical protein BAJATHORv1_50043 [Candidatus Thorarchaeota archaeon]|nr:MAG: hypothetical protein BAJATHORv1_50043 [Candidatus Thorarchaeota archaeon]